MAVYFDQRYRARGQGCCWCCWVFSFSFSHFANTLPCTTLNKGWWTARLFEWMTLLLAVNMETINNISPARQASSLVSTETFLKKFAVQTYIYFLYVHHLEFKCQLTPSETKVFIEVKVLNQNIKFEPVIIKLCRWWNGERLNINQSD